LSGGNGCSNKSYTSHLDAGDDYGYYEKEYTEDGKQTETGGNAMEYPVEREISAGVPLQEAGCEVYTDLPEFWDCT
jgi:hypothetical protein